jgi:hypothetical protein
MPLPQNQKTIRVIQINAGSKKYFCKTTQEQRVFLENNPNAKTESFTIDLPDFIAKKYLNDAENKKQFQEKKVG